MSTVQDPKDVFASIRSDLRLLRATTLGLLLIVVCGVVYIWFSSSRTNQALCSLRADVAGRAQVSEDFLKKNPDGIPGISAGAIRQTLAGQQKTVRALSNLSC